MGSRSPSLYRSIRMIQTFILVTFLTHLSPGIPIKSPIQRAAEAILRRPQVFNAAIEEQRTSERVERSKTSAAEGRRRQEICEVEESTTFLTDLPVTARARKCKTPGLHPFLGEGCTCMHYQSVSVSGI